jgi:DNA-binding NarL/FixJ family response regulator
MARCLIVANHSMGGGQLATHLVRLHDADPELVFHLIVPQRGVEAYEFSWAAGFGVPMGIGNLLEDGLKQAQERLDEVLELLRSRGLTISGELGPAPPLAAIESAMKDEPCDQIVISTLPAVFSRWLRMDLPRRVQRRFRLPVTTIVHDADDADLVSLPEPVAVLADADRTEKRTELREAAAEHRVEVLVLDGDGSDAQRAAAALEGTGLCSLHRVPTHNQAAAFLRGEGRFAGCARPDLVVVGSGAVAADHADAQVQLAELAAEVDRRRVALLVVADADVPADRRRADALGAWAYVPLSTSAAENAELLELMLVELVALERRAPVDPT